MSYPSFNRPIFIALVLPMLVLLSPMSALGDECSACHGSAAYKVQQRQLYDYVQDFNESIHGISGLVCSDCHGGDPTTTDMDKAHVGVKDRVRYNNIPETCGSCHDEQYTNFTQSDHYKTLMDEGTAPNCVTCHGAMEMDVIFAARVKNTCLFCHNQQSGTAPDMPDRAEYVLSKINVIKGYKSFVATYLPDQEVVKQIEKNYSALTGHWHLFNMDQVEVETQGLLSMLRKEKAKALKEKRNK